MAVYILVKSTRLHSLHCYSHTYQILAHWHTPIHCKNLQTKNPAETPTNPTCLQHIHTLHLHNTTYLHCPYIHALQLQPTLLYHHYNTTRPIIYATQWPCPCTHSQWACGWPGKRPFASDRTLCAATSIGDHITSWRRKEYWIPPKTCNSDRLQNHWVHTEVWNGVGPEGVRFFLEEKNSRRVCITIYSGRVRVIFWNFAPKLKYFTNLEILSHFNSWGGFQKKIQDFCSVAKIRDFWSGRHQYDVK